MALDNSTANLIRNYSEQYNVPTYILGSIIEVESQYNTRAIGDYGASFGLLQLYTKGGQGDGYTKEQLLNPNTNLKIGTPPIAKAYQDGVKKGLSGYALLEYTAGHSGHPSYNGTWTGSGSSYYPTMLKKAYQNGDELTTLQKFFNFISGKKDNVSSTLLDRLETLGKAKGKTINISSGYRTIEEQTTLWNNSDKSGKMVAEPGKSRHNYGLAVDVSDNWIKQMSSKELEKYGLHKPMSYENWHIEPIETKKISSVVDMDNLRKKIDGTSLGGLGLNYLTGYTGFFQNRQEAEDEPNPLKKIDKLSSVNFPSSVTDIPMTMYNNGKAYFLRFILAVIGLLFITFSLIIITKN